MPCGAMALTHKYASDTRRLPFHIVGADSESKLPPCALYYTVQPGDTCNRIAERERVPMSASLH